MNVAALVATPPGVMIAIFPVLPVVGAVAVTRLSLLTVKVVATTPPNVTRVACESSDPEIWTEVPGGPAFGVNDVITGVTLNVFKLVRVVAPVVTVTVPVCAPAGIVARMNVLPVRAVVVAHGRTAQERR